MVVEAVEAPSQNSWQRCTQSATSASGPASSRPGRHCAERLRVIRPARSSTFRCLKIAGMLTA
ncbi:hypothetical protein, partial [Pseudonocardia sp.]|uniref:hypothetical protein n=1 Tax=Pseudonocardia sp. TaxID=60912 RepID=UPI0031FBD969